MWEGGEKGKEAKNGYTIKQTHWLNDKIFYHWWIAISMLSCSASYSDKPILRDKQTQTRDLSSIIPQPLSLPLPPTFPHFPPPSSLVLPDLAFPQWGRTPMNRDVGTGPVAQWATHSFVHLFACTAHSLACSALLAHSLTPELIGKWMIRWLFLLCLSLFWTIVEK